VSTLLSDVATLIGDGSSDFQTTLLVGLKQVLRIVPAYLFSDRMFRQTTTTVTSGNSTVSMPSGATQIAAFYYIKSGETDKNFLKYIPIADMEDLYSTSSGTPTYYTLRGQDIILEFPFDTDVTLYMTANIINVNDVETGDTLDFPPEVIAAVQEGLTWQGYKYMEDPRETLAKQDFTALLKIAQKEYTQRAVGVHIINSGRY